MTSDFSDIYSRFYQRVIDYDIASLSEEVANEVLFGYMRSVASKPMVRRLFSSITIDGDSEEIQYELRQPWDDDSDKDYVEEILATGMVAEWAHPRYHSTLLTSQMFSNSEQKYYSQAPHLAEMKELLTKAQVDLHKLIRDRGYNLSVVNGVQ